MIALSLLLLAAPALEPIDAKIAAAPLDCVEIDASECRLVEDLLLAEFASDDRFSAVISGQDLNNLLSLEQQKMAMGCAQTSCLSELGIALNVGHLLTSKIGTVGGQTTLSFALLNTQEATVVVRRQTLIERKEALPQALKALVADGLDEFFTKTGGTQANKQKVETTQGQVEGIAVFDLEAVHGVKTSMARVLSDILLSNLTDSGRFSSVVSGEDIKQMLDLEQQKNALGCNDDSCMAEIGGALGVPFMAVPTMGKLGGQFVLNLKILDVEAARVRARVSRTVAREVDLPAAVLALTRVALEHLFEGAENVQNRKAVRRLTRSIMNGTGVSLLVGATLGFGYSVVNYHQSLTTYLDQADTDNYDDFQAVRQRTQTIRIAGIAAILSSVALAAFAPASTPDIAPSNP